MDKKSRILLIAFFLLVIGTVVFTYWRIFIQKNYIISNQEDCDPYSEKCFIWECDPNSTVEGEKCTGDAEMDTWYYKIIQRKAYNVPSCNPEEDENCQLFVCEENEKDCAESFCEEGNADGIPCNDPEEYTLNNPIEENEAVEEEGKMTSEGEEECVPDEKTGVTCEATLETTEEGAETE